MELPRILALETSGRHGSIAVAQGPLLLATRELSPTTRHAAELMPAIRDLTRAQGWQPNQIAQVYLSLGPGSFTGLRIAVAVARALHQAIGCQLVGVPSLDVIAENAPAEYGLVLPILDAKRNQVFAARYERQPDGALLQTAAAALVDPAAFLDSALARAHERQSRIALLGEGLVHFRPAPHPLLTELPPALWPGTAATVHRLGYGLAQRQQFSDPASLLPLYIRLPEAEEVYRRKQGLAL